MLPNANNGDASPEAQQRVQKEEMERRNNEMKNTILSQILDQQARARLNTLAMTKPDKARAVENLLINMARSSGLPGQITDDQLKNILNDIASHSKKTPEVKFDRRRAAIDSDDDDF